MTITLTADDKIILDRIDQSQDDLVARAVAWAHIQSGSRNEPGLRAMAEALEAPLRRLGGTLEILELQPIVSVGPDGTQNTIKTGPALRLRVRPQAPLRVIFTGHYDTVFEATTSFTHVVHRPDGALNGPGIADMKGGLSVMLGALEAFERHPEAASVGYTVLLSPDEEIGSPASAPALAEVAREGDVGFTYEPAQPDGALTAARKGSGNFDIVVRGRSAHAGRNPEDGRNAIVAAARLALAFSGLTGKKPDLTANVSRIDGGGPSNVVPSIAIVRLNLRAEETATSEWATQELFKICGTVAGDGISTEVRGGFHRPPKPFTPAQLQLFERIRETGALLGQDLQWRPSGGVCEGNNLFAAGLPGVDTLGVRGGDIHSADEYAWPESFAERAKLTAALLCQIARGAIDVRAIKADMKA